MNIKSNALADRVAKAVGGKVGMKAWDHQLNAEVLSILFGDVTPRPRSFVVLMRERKDGR